MPKYLVKSKGFIDGKLYDPDGKRRTVVTSKPLKKVPAWLEPIKETTQAKKGKGKPAAKDEAPTPDEPPASTEAGFMGDPVSIVETL